MAPLPVEGDVVPDRDRDLRRPRLRRPARRGWQPPDGRAAGVAGRAAVRRFPDPDDGRLTIVSLTESGRQVVRSKDSARIRQLSGVLSERFTSEELEVLLAAAPLIERLGEGLR
jgi:hypothetical protein